MTNGTSIKAEWNMVNVGAFSWESAKAIAVDIVGINSYDEDEKVRIFFPKSCITVEAGELFVPAWMLDNKVSEKYRARCHGSNPVFFPSVVELLAA